MTIQQKTSIKAYSRQIKNWLIDRPQNVAVDRQVATIMDVYRRMPQGLLLGPILSNIFINEFGNNITFLMVNFDDDSGESK